MPGPVEVGVVEVGDGAVGRVEVRVGRGDASDEGLGVRDALVVVECVVPGADVGIGVSGAVEVVVGLGVGLDVTGTAGAPAEHPASSATAAPAQASRLSTCHHLDSPSA